MPDYNVIAEVNVSPTRRRAAGWMSMLASYSPAVGRTPHGRSELIVTISARSLEHAVTTGLAIMMRAAGELNSFEVLTTAEYDHRSDDIGMPELIGAREAADLLGVSRQRIQQMAAAGLLPWQKIGRSLVLPRATIEAIAVRSAQE